MLANAQVAVVMDVAVKGKIGDGEIFVSSMESMLRIRTGETDE